METVKTINLEITGVVTVPEGTEVVAFAVEFMEWIESKGYTFGGSVVPFPEDEIPY